MRTFDHSSRSAFVRSHTDIGREGLALILHSSSSRRCSIGLRSGLCAGQSSSSTSNSMSLWTCFVHWCTVILEQEGAIPKLFPQSWEHEIVQHLLVFWSIQSSKPISWKTTPHYNPPPPNFTLGTMQSDKYCSPGNLQTQTLPSDCQM